MSKMQLTAEPGKQDFVITCEFDAPRAQVFRAYTEPELVAQWWGPAQYSVEIDALEAKPGGLWRYRHHVGDDLTLVHFGVFHTVQAPDRLVNTYEIEGFPGGVGLVTLILDERDGRTLLTETSLFPSVDARDAVIGSGMEGGAAESLDRLDALVRTLG
jgi:uncharacterized protein YndB with AHSA1/START domain